LEILDQAGKVSVLNFNGLVLAGFHFALQRCVWSEGGRLFSTEEPELCGEIR
jgi:hypothetical protein